MVLEEPLDADEDELIPSFDDGVREIRTEDVPRSKSTVECLLEFERTVVPKMIDSDWMSFVAKSKSAPYYNDTEQNLNAHILPGVEIAADIVEQAPGLNPDRDLKDVISLWTIHDIHKIVKNNNKEFDITVSKVSDWVENLDLGKYNDNLSKKDYHSCAVALHNQEPSNLDDSTNRFTELRPTLRLIDATVSVSTPNKFVEQAKRPVSKVFSKPNKIYVPASHQIDFNDSVVRTIVNERLYEYFRDKGYYLIDIRDDGVLYAKPEDVDPISNSKDFISDITESTLDNLRNAYQIYTNKSFLGSDISSPSSRNNYAKMPRVYEISDLSHICLDKSEIIQRIVQAAVEQQNKPWNISKESRRQIKLVEEILNDDIPKHSMIEGLATLIHTVFREILPYIVDDSSPHVYERTLEAAILHLFCVREPTQEKFLKLLESDKISASPINWPYKYVIAKDLHNRFTAGMSRTERQRKLIEMLLDRLDDFSNWDDFGQKQIGDIKDEFYIRIAANCSINGKPITQREDMNFLDMVNSQGKNGECHICGTATGQNPSSPSLLDNRDFDILDRKFITEEGGSLVEKSFNNIVPREPFCISCQMALSIRAQQFNSYNSETSLHVTVHPVNSTAVGSYTRFKKILHEIKTKTFVKSGGISYHRIGPNYEDIMNDYLDHPSSIDEMVDRENAFDVGKRMDEASSQLSLPDKSRETMIRGVTAVTIAALISGVSVCITKKPQLYTRSHKNRDVIRYGPNLQEFQNIIDDKTDIMTLPEQIKILDRLMSIGNKIGSPNIAIKNYSELGDDKVMSGTRLYNSLSHMIDDKNTKALYIDIATIDAITTKNDPTSNELLVEIGNMGRSLGSISKTEDKGKMRSIIYDTIEIAGSTEYNDTKEIKEVIRKKFINSEYIDLSTNEDQLDEYVESIISIYEKYGKDDENLGSLRQVILNGVEIRAILKFNSSGDKV